MANVNMNDPQYCGVRTGLPLVVRLDPAFIPISPDFWNASQVWLTTAERLVESIPDIPDYKFHAVVVGELGEIIHTIDIALESLDLSDALLPPLRSLLLYQSYILQLRHHLLQDANDLRRAICILGILPQFYDSTDTQRSRDISCHLGDFLKLASDIFTDHRHPSEFRPSRLFKSPGSPSDFMTRARSITKLAEDMSHLSAEVCGCNSQSPIIQDLDWVIATVDSIVECCKPSDEDLEAIARLQTVQVLALQARFRLLGNVADLDRSVFLSEITSQFHNPVSGLPYPDLRSFAFTPTEPSEHLDAKIAVGEELLKHPHGETQLYVLSKLASLLIQRCRSRCSIVDGERVLQLCEEVLPFELKEKNRLGWLKARSSALHRLSGFGKQFLDLTQGLEILDEGSPDSELDAWKAGFLWDQLKIAAISGNEQAAVSALREIHARDYAHFELSIAMFLEESEADLLNTVQKLKQMCIVHSQEETFRPFAIILVIALTRLCDLTGDAQYLRQAVSLRSRLGPSGSYGFDHTLYLRVALTDFDHVEKRSDAVKALAASSRGISSKFPEVSGWKPTPGQREVVGSWARCVQKSLISMTGKGESVLSRKVAKGQTYSRTGDTTDFDIEYRELLLQLSASKDDPRLRCKASDNLGDLYFCRYCRQKDIKDLEHAVYWCQETIDILLEDEQTRSAWGWRVGWADRLFKLHEATHSVEYPRLLQAHDYYRQAAASACCGPQSRLICVTQWMKHLPGFIQDRVEYAFDVAELALSLLEEEGWAASSSRFSINTRHENTFLGDLITCVALLAGSNAGVFTKAIELIEASQALVWSQLCRLRAPLGDLEIVSPVLASRFQQLSKLLESRMGLSNANPEEDGDPFGTNNWQLNQDMNQVIKEIRTLPGFERFLQRRTFGIDEINELAKDGPVVVLGLEIPHALILSRNHLAFIEIPVTPLTLRNLHRSLQSKAKARDAYDGLNPAEEPLGINTPVAGPSNSRAGMKVEHDRSKLKLEDTLEALWRQVVEPILTWIFEGRADGKGKSKAWKIPKLEDRPRIWWCCQGEFSFFPIHAAGIYSGGSQICLSDFFVSSYTPTLTALLDARERPIPPEIKILAAAQPNPGGRWNKLKQVKDELREIVQATPPAHLIPLGDANQPDYEGDYTTVENILKKLPEASALHLACHGTQNTKDPLNSGFILANAKRLTIEELMKHRLPNAHTAILSACHTASNDAEQPKEAINLSSALMFLGFSNILATKWPMNDYDGPIIANAVYKALFDTTQRPQSTNDPADSQVSPHAESTGNGERSLTLESFSLARVVDGIARHLRLEKKVPATRWATFVHVGI